MERDDLNDVQHLTARIAALEQVVKLLLAANASRSNNPADTLDQELKNIKSSAQNISRPIDPASDAVWNEMFLAIERLYADARSRFSREGPPSA